MTRRRPAYGLWPWYERSDRRKMIAVPLAQPQLCVRLGRFAFLDSRPSIPMVQIEVIRRLRYFLMRGVATAWESAWVYQVVAGVVLGTALRVVTWAIVAAFVVIRANRRAR